MLLSRGYVDEHQGLAVPSQTVLEEVGQLGVPVRDVGVLLGEGHDDVAQVGERLVDGLGLGQPQPLAPALLDPLTACQVHLRRRMVRLTQD